MFKISRDTIDSWLSLEKTGSLFKEPTWSKPKAIPVNVFEEYINDKANQSKFLKEMAKDLNVSATAIHRVKTKLNITRKKNKNPSKKQMKTKENNSL